MNKKVLFWAFTAMALTACSNNETPESANEATAKIRLSASIDATLTRAADGIQSTKIVTSSSTDDYRPSVYVYKNTETSTTSGYGYENIDVTAVDASGNFTTTDMFYPQSRGPVDVYVYAPRVATGASLTAMPITVLSDQSGQTNYLRSDFIYGQALNQAYPSGTPAAINVTLKHALSKIKLVITGGTGSPSISGSSVKEVKLGHATDATKQPLTQATVNITNATLSSAVTTATSGATSVIKFANSSTAQSTVTAIIPPQTLTSCPLSVTIDDAVFTAELSSPAGGFAAGNQYTYSVKVDLKGLTISSTEITPWTNVDVSGSINVE